MIRWQQPNQKQVVYSSGNHTTQARCCCHQWEMFFGDGIATASIPKKMQRDVPVHAGQEHLSAAAGLKPHGERVQRRSSDDTPAHIFTHQSSLPCKTTHVLIISQTCGRQEVRGMVQKAPNICAPPYHHHHQ